MPLNAQKYREALVGLGPGRPVFIDPPAKYRPWLEQNNVPNDVVEFLLETAFTGHVTFPGGCGGMETALGVMSLNDQETAILAGGLLTVGGTTNGDFIVIDLRDKGRQSGFVSHDELWEGDSWTDVREIFAPVSHSIDEMLTKMSARDRGELDHYPRDYCDALSWNRDA